MSRYLKIIYLILTIAGCCSQEKANKAEDNLYSDNASTRNEAALTLAGCGSKAKNSTSKLIELLHDPNIGVQSSAAFALRKIDTQAAREALDKATRK
jgi:HEAT repeat protein